MERQYGSRRALFLAGHSLGQDRSLQGDPSFTSYDLLGTFRGNRYGPPVSHSFGSPFYWMNHFMAVGSAMENPLPVKALDSQVILHSGNDRFL